MDHAPRSLPSNRPLSMSSHPSTVELAGPTRWLAAMGALVLVSTAIACPGGGGQQTQTGTATQTSAADTVDTSGKDSGKASSETKAGSDSDSGTKSESSDEDGSSGSSDTKSDDDASSEVGDDSDSSSASADSDASGDDANDESGDDTGKTDDTDDTASSEDGQDDDTSDDDESTGSDECPHTPVMGDPEVKLEEIADGFNWPIYVTGDPTDPERLFVVEQGGKIKILEPGATTAPSEDFLVVNTRRSGEKGLLGFAFHPDYPDDKRFYVHYNPGGANTTRISEFKVGSDPSKADEDERVVYETSQPEANHNGGSIEFGPDGYLYISLGDGGGAGDKHGSVGNGQDLSTPLGAMLRIDVEPGGGQQYQIPADNPFVGQNGVKPEIWAYGLRNVWRFSFDPETGWLYGADVGQNAWEYVHVIESGKNYGWRPVEGSYCYPSGQDCSGGAGPNEENPDGYVMPLSEYRHRGGQASVTGGYVYRYCEVPGWQGRYFYADYVTGELFALNWDGKTVDDHGVVETFQYHAFTSFGSNSRGEVFAAVRNTLDGSGKIYRLAPKN